MRLDFSNERVLAVVAHPDDAELQCAGTLARARQDGAAIAICVMCKGDRGQPGRPIKNLAAVRKREMTKAARLLGAKLYTCSISDGALVDDVPTRRKLIEVFRKFKPTLVLAPDNDDYHTDHQAAGRIAAAATWYCASKGHKTTSAALAVPPALWWMDTINMQGFEPGFFVDITPHMQIKEQMLACHKSQISRSADADLPPVVDTLRRQAHARGAQADVCAAEAFRIANVMKRAKAW